jgi:hypothetical protein
MFEDESFLRRYAARMRALFESHTGFSERESCQTLSITNRSHRGPSLPGYFPQTTILHSHQLLIGLLEYVGSTAYFAATPNQPTAANRRQLT